jgi:hypothetical protein
MELNSLSKPRKVSLVAHSEFDLPDEFSLVEKTGAISAGS